MKTYFTGLVCNIPSALILGIVIFTSVVSVSVKANPIIINPVDDGSIYSSGSVNNSSYLMLSGTIRGVVEFPMTSIIDTISESLLSVNPYGSPLHGPFVEVYGYESNDGQLTSADYDAGVFLGTWHLSDFDSNGDTFFDVTSFLTEVSSPYVGFNLRSSGTDVLSSLEYNYGHPAQLTITTIPEPITLSLLTLGAFLTGRKRR